MQIFLLFYIAGTSKRIQATFDLSTLLLVAPLKI